MYGSSYARRLLRMGTRCSPYLPEQPSRAVDKAAPASLILDLATISLRMPIVMEPKSSIWLMSMPKALLSRELNWVATQLLSEVYTEI